MIDTPGIYEIPASEYHADPCPEPSLSASVARTLIDRSPLHAWMQHPKLGGKQEEKPAAKMSLGTAAHSVILQGSWGSIGFIDKDSYRTNAAKELRDKILAAGGTPLLEKDRETIEQMVAEFNRGGVATGGFETERTLIWQDKATESAHDDLVPGSGLTCWETGLSSTSKPRAVPATPERWGRTLLWDYAMQCGFYRRGYQGPEGRKAPRVPVHRAGDHAPLFGGLSSAFDGAGLDYADYLAEQAVWKWGECIESQEEWPSYADGVNVMEAPYWVREKLEVG